MHIPQIILGVRKFTTYHADKSRHHVVREALLLNGQVIPWPMPTPVPKGAQETLGHQDSTGVTHGGGHFASLVGWQPGPPLRDIVSELLWRRLQRLSRGVNMAPREDVLQLAARICAGVLSDKAACLALCDLLQEQQGLCGLLMSEPGFRQIVVEAKAVAYDSLTRR